MNNCKKARNVQDDCIRIIALILMVTTHSNKQSLSPILLSLLPVITLTCNGLYFMLSGKYNLLISIFLNYSDSDSRKDIFGLFPILLD